MAGPVDATNPSHLMEEPIAMVMRWRARRKHAALQNNAHAKICSPRVTANTGRAWATVQVGYMWGL